MKNMLCLIVGMSSSLAIQAQQSARAISAPTFLKQAIDRGNQGDVFDKLRANERAKFLHRPAPFPMEEAVLNEKMNKMATAKDPRAMAYLGLRGFEDYGHPEKRDHAKDLLRQAAEIGSTSAQLKWAHIVWAEKQDSKEATYWWNSAYQIIEKQAQQGDLDSMFELGNYRLPPGVSTGNQNAFSQETTRSWLRKAAEMGHVEAASMLGHVLELTGQNEEDRREAWRWMSMAAEAGDVASMVAMGRHYATKSKGTSWFGFVDNDPVKAWQWWDRAAALIGESEVGEYLADLREGGLLPPRPKNVPPLQRLHPRH